MNKLVIAVDPGFGGTGICMLIDGKLYKFSNVKSSKEGDDRYLDVASKCCRHALDWINDIRAAATCLDETKISEVDIVIESPHMMGGVAGHASLARGDVFKVAKIAGAIGVLLATYIASRLTDVEELYFTHDSIIETPVRLHYPEVREWKGQLPKDVTKKRVLRDVQYAHAYIKDKKYKLMEKYPDHIFDAVGLGMWFVENKQ